MKKTIVAAGVLLALGVASGSAEARSGGCLKYGLGGAVAGHFAGGHGVAGAAAGCALGMYKRHQANQPSYQQGRRDRGPATDDRATGSIGRPGLDSGSESNHY
jgi:hypothetical protein